MSLITTTGSWQGAPFPADVQRYFLNKLLEGAAFANSLTRLPTSSGTVIFPLVAPEGAGWVRETQQLPAIDPNDDVATAAVSKLGGLVELSNESIGDGSFPHRQRARSGHPQQLRRRAGPSPFIWPRTTFG